MHCILFSCRNLPVFNRRPVNIPVNLYVRFPSHPRSPEYTAACESATAITGVPVRYLAQYAHGAHAIGLVLKRGRAIEVALRRRESKYGPTGGYLRALEHALSALLREWHEEESPDVKIPVTIEDIFKYGSFVGLIDAIGHTVASQAKLREWTILLMLDLPADREIPFTPTPETEAKALLTHAHIRNNPDIYRGDGEYPLLLRAAYAAANPQLDLLPKLTNDPLGQGVYMNIVDIDHVTL